MKNAFLTRLSACILAAASVSATAATPSRDEVIRLVDAALPSVIGNDNRQLVSNLLAARFGKPVADNLNVSRSLATVFGRRLPKLDPECSRTVTEATELSRGECVAAQGLIAGSGGYLEFAWDRNLEFGNVRYLRRDADGTTAPGALPAVQLSDEEAWKRGTDFLVNTLGLPPEEFVPRLPGARSMAVRTLLIGEQDPTGKKTVKPVLKLVKFSRSVEVNLPGPTGASVPTRIRAPGEALALIGNGGVMMARVKDWLLLESSSLVDPANAKTRAELIDEIADAYLSIGDEGTPQINAQLVIKEPEPEDVALLLPAVQKVREAAARMPAVEISISVVARDPGEAEQERAGPSTAGHTHQFALVRVPESKTQTDE